MFKKIFLFIALLSFLFAGTQYNATVYIKDEIKGVLQYYGTITFDDSTTAGNWYTQAFRIAGCGAEYGWIDVDVSEVGTEDINVFLEVSNNLIDWTALTTDKDVDACGTTAKRDTVGISENVSQLALTKSHIWMRIHAVPGQTCGGSGYAVLTYYITFNVPATLIPFNNTLGLTANKK
jgi:hypothetical protein